MDRVSQNQKVLNYMRLYGSITQKQAAATFGCYRLSARIYDLRHDGHTIVTEHLRVNNANVARYWLMDEQEGQTDED